MSARCRPAGVLERYQPESVRAASKSRHIDPAGAGLTIGSPRGCDGGDDGDGESDECDGDEHSHPH